MNRTVAIIEALEEVECAARELLRRVVDDYSELQDELETEELAEALENLDVVRVQEGAVAHG